MTYLAAILSRTLGILSSIAKSTATICLPPPFAPGSAVELTVR